MDSTDIAQGTRRTARLLLEPLTAQDAADVLRIYGDPDTWRHLPQGRLRHLEDARAQIERSRRSRRDHGLGMWAVRVLPHAADAPLEAGEFIGCGGVRFLEAAGVWNLGYRLSPRAWGRGFATEIAAAAQTAAAEADARIPLTARALTSNPSSVAVLEKIGLRLVTEHPFPSADPDLGAGEDLTSVEVPRERIYADRDLVPTMIRRLAELG